MSLTILTGGDKMIAVKIAAFVVIMACVLGLEYGGSRYTRGTQQGIQQGTQEAGLGFVDSWVKDRQTVNIPVLVGVGAITIGGAFLFFKNKKN
jgi:LPXTG-motif cell wall-anchored protein